MIFFSLRENAIKFIVGGLELSCFLFELFEGSNAVFKEFVESFAFFFIPVSFFLVIFECKRKAFIFFNLNFIVSLDFSV